MWIRLGRWLSLIACLSLAGGHWAMLQTAAWSGMLLEYGRSYGVEKAVSMTFDGDHPCALCKKIEAAQKQQSSSEAPQAPRTKEIKPQPAAPLPKRMALNDPPSSRLGIERHHFSADSRRDAPPLPPPRWLGA